MYNQSTIRRAEQILGYGIATGTGVREYPVIDGVVYTDVFEGAATVEGLTDVATGFNGKKNGTVYKNELYITSKCPKTVKVTAAWGSTALQTELKDLLDWIKDDSVVDSLDTTATKSLRIKDYSETFATASEVSENVNAIVMRGWGFYVRRPLIISFGEQKDAAGHF